MLLMALKDVEKGSVANLQVNKLSLCSFKADIPHQLQIYLMLKGYLPSPWSVSNYVEITLHDWFDNKITLPAISSLSLLFSFANMIRAANILNIYKTYGSTCEFR